MAAGGAGAAAGAFVGDVTALELVRGPGGRPVVLAGAGGALRVLAGGPAPAGGAQAAGPHVLLQQRVLRPGSRVHGIRALPSGSGSGGAAAWSLLVFGERELVQATLQLEPRPSLRVSPPLGPFSTWVLDAAIPESASDASSSSASRSDERPVVAGCDDNSVSLWLKGERATRVVCSERCLLYSMSLLASVNGTPGRGCFTVAAGTIFHDVLIWCSGPLLPGEPVGSRPRTSESQGCPPLARLCGHRGSIYRVLWVEDGLGRRGRRLMSASDDRTGRVWEMRDSHGPRDSAARWESRACAFGHDARVWDCAQLSAGDGGFQALVTASEDCSCRVWNFEGQEMCRLAGHRGRGVWKVAAGFGFVVSAGADGAVKLWHAVDWVPALAGPGRASQLGYVLSADCPPPEQAPGLAPPPAVSKGLSACREKPAKAEDWVQCLEADPGGALFLATHKGRMYRVSSSGPGKAETWETVHRSNRGAPFSCMSLFEDGQGGMLLGDLQGYATVVARGASGWEAFEWEAHSGRAVLGVFRRAGQRALSITTDRAGELKCWHVAGAAECVHFGSSPHGKMIMCMDFCASSGLLACGDKKGNVFAFDLDGLKKSVEPMQAIVSVEKSHLPEAVTMIRAAPSCIMSGGRDGCIFEHCDFVSQDTGRRVLRPTSRRKFQAMTSVHYCFDVGGTTLLGGFQGGEFVLWNDGEGCAVLRVGCGGFNRPHALRVSGLSDVTFSFYKYNEVVIQTYRNNSGVLACQTLTPGFHGKEIHGVRLVPLMGAGFPIGAFTCSEDGSVKCVRLGGSSGEYTVQSFSGERIAGAAMRAVSAHRLPSGSRVAPEWLVVSAGAQLILNAWHVKLKGAALDAPECGMSIEWVGARIPHRTKKWKQQGEKPETKHRCLSVCSTSFPGAENPHTSFLVVSTSDASLQLLALSVRDGRPSWQLAAGLCYHDSPVLSTALQDIGGRTIVASGATDGSIALWDISPAIGAFGPGAEALRVRPILEMRGVHQSGVNALHLSTCCPPGPAPPFPGGVRFSVASGGDDQAVRVAVCCMAPPPDPRCVFVVDAFSEERAHGSAVKGVWVDGDLLLSGGRDQRVRFWRLENGGLNLRHETVVDVGNMCAMDVMPQATPGGSVQYHVFACGRGLQALCFDRGQY